MNQRFDGLHAAGLALATAYRTFRLFQYHLVNEETSPCEDLPTVSSWLRDGRLPADVTRCMAGACAWSGDLTVKITNADEFVLVASGVGRDVKGTAGSAGKLVAFIVENPGRWPDDWTRARSLDPANRRRTAEACATDVEIGLTTWAIETAAGLIPAPPADWSLALATLVDHKIISSPYSELIAAEVERVLVPVGSLVAGDAGASRWNIQVTAD